MMRFIKIKKFLGSLYVLVVDALRFALLIIITILYKSILWILGKFNITSGEKLNGIYTRIINIFDPVVHGAIRRVELINLGFKGLRTKRARSNITIGGIAIGIGVVVYLVSLGYGLEELVISRIASLEALKQIDVTTQIGSKLKIDDKTLSLIKNMGQVENIYPLISAAGKVNYQNSQADVAVYGVTRGYLDVSSTNLLSGKLFESDEIIRLIPTNTDNAALTIQEEIVAEDVATLSNINTSTVSYANTNPREIVVNKALLNLLSINESTAVGSEISMVSVIVGSLLEQSNSRIQTTSVDYLIIGVIENESEPMAYVPFIDFRSLGVPYYSQAKVLLSSSDDISRVRPQINGLGYSTSSVVDTVEQVTELFSKIRLVLGGVGVIALVIAALGMFNTLTVSLLERTREIGLMKTMGMKSNEIRKLFLSESLVIGVLGGFLGLILGYVAGLLTSIIASLLVITKGVGFINVAKIPLEFMLLIIFISFLVGMVTGIFPAKRATEISALNALRYE